MRKRIRGRKFGRERDTRRALFRSLVGSLVEYGEIKTTKAKAKAIQPLIDRLIRKAQKNTDSLRRDVFARLGNNKKTTKKIFLMADKLFKTRTSGFTRIIKIGERRGDRAEIVKLEFVEKLTIVEEKPKKETKTKKGKAGNEKNKKSKAKKSEKMEKRDEKKEKKTKKGFFRKRK